MLLLQVLGFGSPVLLPVLLVARRRRAGVAAGGRRRSAPGGAAPGRRRPLGALAGTALVGVGLLGFLATRGELQRAREGLLSTVLVVAGVALLSAPWWVRTAQDLRAERRERIRSQERAELAAHVHDSVLQTLALIRKASDDPREVQRLARTQERELRAWLYPPAAAEGTTLAGALQAAVAEVEEAHGLTVEAVVVGDAPASPARARRWSPPRARR